MSTATPDLLSAWGDTPPQWVRLLDEQVRKTNMTEAARVIGVDRATVSTVLRNKYPALSTARIEDRVMKTLGQVDCPALEAAIACIQCQAFRERPEPTGSLAARQLWIACRLCPHNPRDNRENVHAH